MLLTLLIIVPLMMGLMYAQIDHWVLMFKHQKAEHTMHQHLARMQIEGYLTPGDRSELTTAFSGFGCPVANIQATSSRVRRFDANNMVSLKITCNPTPAPLRANKFFNAPSEGVQIKVGGSMRSERVNP
ncbi:MAG: hypothetical protein GX295_11695 [Syntrophomonadaceae bacterium]|nr:hypothetical protein [Syntrophomonadaceae bacterium]